MTLRYWPTSLPQRPMRNGLNGGRLGNLHAFQPERGPDITRPIGTGSSEQFGLSLPPLSSQDFKVFDDWYQGTLGQGSHSFIWRHPFTLAVRWCKFDVSGGRGYSLAPWGRRKVVVGFQIFVQPAIPWFADYIPAGVSRVPYFVADYANGVYGIDGKTVAASALPTIAGTFWVQRTTTTEITEAQETLVAAEIPASAPGTTTKIIGFET